jgi:Holliday junction resolvasome RuvABC DNA-binding subunit
MSASSDEIDALMALGYSLIQAREALSKVDPGVKDSGERIKAALRSISN